MKLFICALSFCFFNATAGAKINNPVLNEIEKRYELAAKNLSLPSLLTAGTKYSCTQFYEDYGILKTRVLDDVFIYFNTQEFQNFGIMKIDKISWSSIPSYYVIYPQNKHSVFEWSIANTEDNKLIVKENAGAYDNNEFKYFGLSSFLVCDLNEGKLTKVSELINSYSQARPPEEKDLKLDKAWSCKSTLATPGYFDSTTSYEFQLVPYSEAGIKVTDLFLNKKRDPYNGHQFYKAIRDVQGKIISFHSNNKNQTIRFDGTNLILENRIAKNPNEQKISFGLPSVEDDQAISISYDICE